MAAVMGTSVMYLSIMCLLRDGQVQQNVVVPGERRVKGDTDGG